VAGGTDAEGRAELPVHFFTIVLNGEPFIRYHLPVLRALPFRWHWHVVEGVAALVHDTAWSVAGGGHVPEEMHRNGLSVDGTTEYLDEAAGTEPERLTLYRRPGEIWRGKREMVSAPLVNIREECLLWQLDADELWTGEQIATMRQAFLDHPERTAAYYWCDFFVAPRAVVTTRWNYTANPGVEWLRTWRYQPGDAWAAHEPPTLLRPVRSARRTSRIDVGRTRPFVHEETEALGAVFQHYAYATEEQVRFKERYYGYGGALDAWHRLQEAIAVRGPVRLADYLPWVEDDTLVDDVERAHVVPLAAPSPEGWRLTAPGKRTLPVPARDGARPIVVDGVYFQDLSSGIGRVWRSLFEEWLRSGFAERIVFLERAGKGPRLPGLRTRSLPRWVPERSAEDSLRLQRICDEVGADLFVSTYYTTPVETPSAMIVYDMIPERLGLDMSDPVWDEKRQAVEHASSYLCISESTRRDLAELEPAARGKPTSTVLLGIDPVFSPASDDEIAEFRSKYRVEGPYVLLVGDRRGVDGYKNSGLVFRAFDAWPGNAGAEIVCVGGHVKIEPEYRRAAPSARIHRLSLSDDELRVAYSGALCLAYPSRYEGFGLPVAEAMACGCPVVTTRVSSIPEVAGDAAVYVDPDDERELAHAFDLVSEPARRAALIESGLERASRFTWASAAEAYAAGLVAAAEADTAEAREARRAHWALLRDRQRREQAHLRPSDPPPPPAPEPIVGPSLLGRIESLAARRLPPALVVRLRAVKVALRRANAAGRRRLYAR
jgi:glycosyltransferase involved in cell wall biosynthesis